VDARRTLGIGWRYYDRLEQVGRELIRRPISGAEFERFLAQLVPLPPRADATGGGRAVRNAERVREAIQTAYRQTPDLANITGSRRGALQAVGAYVDHVCSRPERPPAAPIRRRASSARPNLPRSRTAPSPY
jgi:hypothetical protein